ncbi:MAG: pilus (MSHA type) biogenesis protein MshL [Gammaproteobacteria bacterium]|nr:pilus (MSHA type) biogenesis protein MshL [Gammaproteobacteria bacterium]MBU2056830.1 pilus (MSHA type) biogenesis protein MshL [Gammaproteobacteria bacterium]MBU2174638.1 pilus (MSHA type) biogenesis protein MshL [Gammaproteobacteria bacterium]MBU2248331.1 pilus (MSHA type) biogenesis protein MshL [Gammaproteobacteria bacterium]MBU2346200.1 pilus (MSHA type) biogenesis protein MshL [Gammaproteobacteria bacterium]
MNYFKKNYFTFAFISLGLAGCQGMQETKIPHDAQAALAEQQKQAQAAVPAIPDSVTQDLLALTSPIQQAQPMQQRFNVAAANVDVADFFTSLVADTEYSVAIHPAVSGQITLDLKQVTLNEAFAVIEQLYGYHIKQVGSIYKVMPGGLRTETIAVNYLLMQRSGSSSISVTAGGISSSQGGNSGGNSGGNNQNSNQSNNQNNSNQNGNQNSQGGSGNGSSVQSSSQTDFWKDLKEAITGVMGSGPDRAVVISPQAGLVTVRGLPSEIEAVRAYLGQTEESLQRQVILEVKIIEVTLNDDYQQGINWSQIASTIGSTDISFSNNTFSLGNNITAQVGGLGRIGFEGDDFSGVINLLETQGNAQVLSSPRVTAINNQKAVIKVGSDEYYVTGVSSSSNVTDTTGTGTGVSRDVPIPELEPFFSGIALDVTPQINIDGDVILHVHPSVSETTELSKSINLGGNTSFSLPSAQTNIRESDTIIKARNGEIVVIGGLMQSTISDNESKVPVLGSVPLFGKLFTNISKVERKKELIILIKPTVSTSSAMKQQIKQSADLIDQWYPKN